MDLAVSPLRGIKVTYNKFPGILMGLLVLVTAAINIEAELSVGFVRKSDFLSLAFLLWLGVSLQCAMVLLSGDRSNFWNIASIITYFILLGAMSQRPPDSGLALSFLQRVVNLCAMILLPVIALGSALRKSRS